MNTFLAVSAALFSVFFCAPSPLGNVGSGLGGLGTIGSGLGGLGTIGSGLGGLGTVPNVSDTGNVLGMLGGLPLDPSLLQNVTEEGRSAIEQLLNSSLPISELETQLEQIASQFGFLDQLSSITSTLEQLGENVTAVVSNMPAVLSSLQSILDNKNQTLEQQNEAIHQLAQQNPLETTSLLSILQQLLSPILGGGVLPTGIPTDLPVTLPTVNTDVPL